MRIKILILSCIVALASCSSDDAPTNVVPQLYIGQATDISRTEATLTGSVDDEQAVSALTIQFRYGADSLMKQSVSAERAGSTLSTRLSGLNAGTKYFYQLVATDGRISLNSSTAQFTTESNQAPTVGSPVRLSYGPTSIIVSYEITDDGGDDISATGIYAVESGSQDSLKVSTTPFSGSHTYKIRVGNLKRNTQYSLTAYAINRNGETRSTELIHTTGDAVMLESAGDLSMLMGDDRYSYTSLDIIGSLNGDDIRCLREMMGRDINKIATQGRLSDVNLTDARIVAGGGVYNDSRFTTDDVVSYGMFADLDRLQNISLPDQTISIESGAFSGSTALTHLNIPTNASSVVASSGCTALESISVSGANSHYSSVDGVLFNSDVTEIVWFPIGKKGNYTLPEGITSISDYAFQDCLLTEFYMPSSLVSMGQGVFYNSALQLVVMPDKLGLVPTATFQHCYSLTTVTLGKATELLSNYIFDGCPLADLYVEAEVPPVCYSNTFTTTGNDFLSTCTLHVPQGSKSLYKNHKYWGQFKHITE